MQTPLLYGVAAGLLAAVVFAAGATEAPAFLRIFLLLLTPLPIAVAGLTLGWVAAAAAGVAATAAIAVAAQPALALIFAVTEAVPIAVLSHLALLNRTDPPGATQWYPAGRLAVWAAALGTALAIFSFAMMGGDSGTVRATLKSMLDAFLKAQVSGGGAAGLSPEDMDKLVEAAIGFLPAFTAMSWTMGLLFVLWLAGRLALAAGKLARPWPDLALVSYPRGTSLALAGSTLVALFASGYAQLAASAAAGALFLAYLLLGLAVIHFITRGASWRPFLLWGLYVILIVFSSFAAPLLVILGLADEAASIRARAASPPKTNP